MISFFEGLSRDRRLDEALTLAHQIADPRIRSATESTLAMALLDIQPGRVEHLVDALRALAGVGSRFVQGEADGPSGASTDTGTSSETAEDRRS